jgi:dynein heavy chain
VLKLDKDLTLVGSILNAWNQVQLKWMYLEEIFLNDKFRLQLPAEALQFDMLNQPFKKLMENTQINPEIMRLCQIPGLLNDLNELFEGFELCQKSLNQYLDYKRNYFSRFYFLSDNELLSVLGNTNPNGIQEHIVKMFDNVGSLLFDYDSQKNTLVKAMVSCEKETMTFTNKVMVKGLVESWMKNVLLEMWTSNAYLVKKSIFDYGNTRKSRCKWMLDHQGQMCLAANGVWWTAEVENVFSELAKVQYNTLRVNIS